MAAASQLVANHWVDQPIGFDAGGVEIYGTFRHPVGSANPVPAVLLIAGSGPTDRNDNSPAIGGKVDTIVTLAQWLSEDGVASLRYDKLGSGTTGLGPYAGNPDSIGLLPFEQEAAAGLRYLSRQSDVNRARLGVIGHSEGALFALLLATGVSGRVPPIRMLGLLEPLSIRYLDLISEQFNSEFTKAVAASPPAAQAAQGFRTSLASIVHQLRTSGTLQKDIPPVLASVFNPSTAKFLSEADHYDPAQLAAELPRGITTLVTCSDADIQVSCGDVDHLVAGLHQSESNVDLVQLSGVDHVLKEDSSLTAANYGKPLPFSHQLREVLASSVDRSLK